MGVSPTWLTNVLDVVCTRHRETRKHRFSAKIIIAIKDVVKRLELRASDPAIDSTLRDLRYFHFTFCSHYIQPSAEHPDELRVYYTYLHQVLSYCPPEILEKLQQDDIVNDTTRQFLIESLSSRLGGPHDRICETFVEFWWTHYNTI